MKKQQCGYASGEELFVAVFWWLYVRKHPKVQPAVFWVKKFQKTTQKLKVSSDRLGEPAIELGSTGYKARDISTAPQRLALKSA